MENKLFVLTKKWNGKRKNLNEIVPTYVYTKIHRSNFHCGITVRHDMGNFHRE